MHCVVKVENWKGETVEGATNLSPEFENGKQLNRLIAIEDDLREIAHEFKLFQDKCKQYKSERHYRVTMEIALDEEVLIPKTTVKVPDKVSAYLRMLLLHIKAVCVDQMKNFLEEESKDQDISIVSYQRPAFFKGNIYNV